MILSDKNDKKTVYCEVGLCIYNKDYFCTSHYIEIESSSKCFQFTPVSITEETLEFIPKKALELIKEEHQKKEKEFLNKKLNNE